jgi:N-ethylmaleimide reductase
MPTLFDPAQLGSVAVANRTVMAPMTRSRATGGGVPADLTAEYYRQRAGAGLIVTEATQPSAAGQGYVNTPGLHTDAQEAGWRAVADAVHADGGRIFAQLMHAGRISHPDLLPDGLHPLAPSAVTPTGQAFTATGLQDFVQPRPLTSDEIAATVADFAAAARRAIAAGLDGIEIHGANGYLVQQFLAGNTNRRADAYGGSVENRIRFAVEVVEAVVGAIGADRVGLRISPGSDYNDIAEDDTLELYTALVEALAPLGLAYLHVVEAADPVVNGKIRAAWPGVLIVNPHRAGRDFADPDAAQRLLDDGADLISFARGFLANPDLVERFRTGAPLNQPDQATFYGGDHRGYTDYPTL